MASNVQFNIVKKGYDHQQVQGYIQTLANAYSELYAAHDEQKNRIVWLESEKTRLERLSGQNETVAASEQPHATDSDMITRALAEAEKTAAQIVERAKINAQMNAEKILANAYAERDSLVFIKGELARTIQDAQRIMGNQGHYYENP